MKINKKWITISEIMIIITTLAIVSVMFFLIFWLPFLNYWNKTITTEKIVEATIEMKWAWSTLSRDKYVFTEDNTYKVDDRFFIWYFNSMDTYREATSNEGSECELTTIGHRIWFFSMYKTILDINCWE